MEAMAESGWRVPVAQATIHQGLCGLLERAARAHEDQARVEKSHARLDVAAVMRPKGQDPRRDAVLQWRPGGRHVSRRER